MTSPRSGNGINRWCHQRNLTPCGYRLRVGFRWTNHGGRRSDDLIARLRVPPKDDVERIEDQIHLNRSTKEDSLPLEFDQLRVTQGLYLIRAHEGVHLSPTLPPVPVERFECSEWSPELSVDLGMVGSKSSCESSVGTRRVEEERRKKKWSNDPLKVERHSRILVAEAAEECLPSFYSPQPDSVIEVSNRKA